jgi:hypothetical protein
VSSASDVTVVKELATGQDTVEVQQAQQECSHATNIQLTDLHTRPTQTTDQTQSSEMSDVFTNVIECGYKLHLTITPDSVNIRNNRSAKLHAQFVEEAITELCQSGRVVEFPAPPAVANPLSVSVQASGKKD